MELNVHEYLQVLSPDLAILFGGMAVAGFTQLSKLLQKKTGMDIFQPKNLAAIIALLIGLGYSLSQGGSFQQFIQNLFQGATYAWVSGQGVYHLIKPATKAKKK